ncbi:hypothetical protein P9D57_17620 [Bacillus sonorensis]|uniref:hypothetical protein n=1 Tax=Bacillus sonorensis TaxID=119858 RepID=UPI002DBE00D1|nr:hypothetical protein [Bacillus sonorensis]MEC1440510.1 hypothetical protein [Bacillus sonorensis]
MKPYDAKKNFEDKKKNLELIRQAYEINPNNETAKKLLKHAEDDFKFAEKMLKSYSGDN